MVEGYYFGRGRDYNLFRPKSKSRSGLSLIGGGVSGAVWLKGELLRCNGLLPKGIVQLRNLIVEVPKGVDALLRLIVEVRKGNGDVQRLIVEVPKLNDALQN